MHYDDNHVYDNDKVYFENEELMIPKYSFEKRMEAFFKKNVFLICMLRNFFGSDQGLHDLIPFFEQLFVDLEKPDFSDMTTDQVTLGSVGNRFITQTTPTSRGLSAESMDPADKPREVGWELKCQQPLDDIKTKENQSSDSQPDELPSQENSNTESQSKNPKAKECSDPYPFYLNGAPHRSYRFLRDESFDSEPIGLLSLENANTESQSENLETIVEENNNFDSQSDALTSQENSNTELQSENQKSKEYLDPYPFYLNGAPHRSYRFLRDESFDSEPIGLLSLENANTESQSENLETIVEENNNFDSQSDALTSQENSNTESQSNKLETIVEENNRFDSQSDELTSQEYSNTESQSEKLETIVEENNSFDSQSDELSSQEYSIAESQSENSKVIVENSPHRQQATAQKNKIPQDAFHLRKSQVANYCLPINMQILGGFIAVLGVTAVTVALACTGIWVVPVACIGVAAIVGGFGLFAEGRARNSQGIFPNFMDAGLQIKL